jgi:4-amino-4-deoxy-L-arabinose transferase-like glycosyltransferase
MTEAKRQPSVSALNEVLATEWAHLLIIFFLAVTVMLSKLGGNGLANYDDAHYAQKAKEILQTSDWVTMHYNGKPTFEQPPVFLSFIALSFKAFGVSEYTAKLPSAIFGICTVLLLYYFGKLLFNSWVGLFSACILSTTQIFTRYASRAMQDVTLTFFCTLALYALMLSVRKDRRYFLLWGLSIGMALLVKSVLGLFPALISVVFLLATKRWKMFFDPYFVAGSLLVFLVGCSWYVVQYLWFGDQFYDNHFGWVILQRGFNAEPEPWHAHLSYAKDLLIYYWPWLPVFGFAVWKFAGKSRRDSESAVLCLFWAGIVFLTMSAMQTRRLWYIMQMFPAAAMMCGVVMDEFFGEARRATVAKCWAGLAVLAAVVINATPLPLSKEREKDVRILAPYVRHFGTRGCCVIAFRQEYYGFNNTMIFYSDQNTWPVLQTYDELAERFRRPDTALCFIALEELPALRARAIPFAVTRKVEDYGLISNRTLDISDVKTW